MNRHFIPEADSGGARRYVSMIRRPQALVGALLAAVLASPPKQAAAKEAGGEQAQPSRSDNTRGDPLSAEAPPNHVRPAIELGAGLV
ncbi:MAG TPA: hypothetical protein VGJ84_15280, partial [Polyangiaceae bacterium]